VLRHVGDHLRRCRLDQGLKQRTLALELGVREETLGRWENGLSKPLPKHLGAIVRFLGYDPEPAGEGLPARLGAARRRLGLTQAQLAGRMGVDEGSLCHWENGSRRPNPWMAARIQVALDQLEGGSPEGPVTPSFFDLTRWKRTLPGGATPRTMGERLRARRLALGLSQEAAGALLGVTRATVHRWERDQRRPPASAESLITEFLGGAAL
jgi:transcriptional regulator with XRE-family HTH domain